MEKNSVKNKELAIPPLVSTVQHAIYRTHLFACPNKISVYISVTDE